jgi:hypothetical protein
MPRATRPPGRPPYSCVTAAKASDTAHVTRAHGRYVPPGRVSTPGRVHQAEASWGARPRATSKRPALRGRCDSLAGSRVGWAWHVCCVGMGRRTGPVYVVDVSFRGEISVRSAGEARAVDTWRRSGKGWCTGYSSLPRICLSLLVWHVRKWISAPCAVHTPGFGFIFKVFSSFKFWQQVIA